MTELSARHFRIFQDIKTVNLLQDKTTDAYLKFVFLTGVTKFGQASVFSDLNHLKDISQDARYGKM